MAFKQLVSDLINHQHDLGTDFIPNAISRSDYQQWQKQFTWSALQGLRYGQSFCNHFGIRDHRIYFERNWQLCDTLIRKEWLAKS